MGFFFQLRRESAPRKGRTIRTQEQIIGILHEHEAGAKSADLCRKQGMSEDTFDGWKAKYSGMRVSEAKRLKALEDKNAKLKRLLAEQMLDMAAMKDLLAKSGDACREARGCRASEGPVRAVGIANVKQTVWGTVCSAAGACQIAGPDRRMVRYQSQRAPDTALRCRLRNQANERRSFGYWRLFVLLRREGEPSGINRIYRLYSGEGLNVRKRKARRKAIGTKAPILIEARANARWSLDFVRDQFAYGRRFRVLNVVVDVTRECLAAIPDTSISGRCVVRELTTLIACKGRPGMIVSDNGRELTSNAILKWCAEAKVEWHYIAPGKPPLAHKNMRCRAADAEWLCRKLQRQDAGRDSERDPVSHLAHARDLIATWVTDYNTARPHSAVRYQTPAGFALHLTTAIARPAACDESSARPAIAQPAPIGVNNHRAPVVAV
jgi:putative transposase